MGLLMGNSVRILGILVLLLGASWPSAGHAQDARLLSVPTADRQLWGEILTPGGPGPHPGLILLHGSSGWRPEYLDFAREFADSGFAVLVLDYYAETGGAAIGSTEKLQKWEAWRETVRGAADLLLSLPNVTEDQVALVGLSRGGFLGVSVAASIPAAAAVVEFSGGGGGGTLTLDEEVRGLPPLLILHGEEDVVVPVSFARQLQAAALDAGSHVEMHLFAGEGHVFNAPWAATYSEKAARRSFGLVVAFLRSQFNR